MKRKLFILAAVLLGLIAALPSVTTVAASEPGSGVGHGLDSTVLLGMAVILIVAKLGGEVFERIGQPAVLGELITTLVTPPLLKWSLGRSVSSKQ